MALLSEMLNNTSDNNTSENYVMAIESIIEMVENNAITYNELDILSEDIEYIFNSILDDENLAEAKIIISGVKWDADDEEDIADLPTTVTLKIDDVELEGMSEDDIDDFIADKLSNEYGFTHDGWGSSKVINENLIAEAITFDDFKSCYGSTYIDDEVEMLWDDYMENPEAFKKSDKGQMLLDYIEDEGLTEGLILKKSSMKKRMAAKKYARSVAGKKSRKIMAKKRKKYATKIKRCAGKGKTFSFKTMSCIKKKKRR